MENNNEQQPTTTPQWTPSAHIKPLKLPAKVLQRKSKPKPPNTTETKNSPTSNNNNPTHHSSNLPNHSHHTAQPAIRNYAYPTTTTTTTTNHSRNTLNSRTTTTTTLPSSSKVPILSRSTSYSQYQPAPSSSSSSSSSSSIQYHYLKHRPPSPTPSSSSSTTTDLFAGPRTSIHLDPLTGELLSAAHDVSAMDALIDTLKNDPSSPRLKPHPRSSTRSNPQPHPSTNPSYSIRPSNIPRARPPPSSITTTTTTTTTNTTTGTRIGKIHSLSTNDLTDHQSSNLAIDLQQPSQFNRPDLFPHSPHFNPRESTRSAQSKLSLRCLSRSSHPSQLVQSNPSSNLTSPIQVTSPSQVHLTSAPLPTPPLSAIPSINGIIEKYSKKLHYPPVPPARSPQLKIDSIDEIVEKYNPILKRSTRQDFNQQQQQQQKQQQLTTHTQSNPKHLSPVQDKHHPTGLPITRLRSVSENSDDSHSSINSLTKEALSLQTLLSKQTERSSQPTHFINSPSGSPKLRQRDPDSISKRSFSPTQRSPIKPSTMAEDRASAKSQADDQIALYLRSTRLTTLIKLQRQQSPMTVSLADVGSPTGHPVIVFLGLGCVRYLVGLYDELAEALGLRIICIDRWGLGKTTEVPDEQRGFLEWASVVEEVADQLLLDRFSILAHSAGAPYALASSLRLADRVYGSIHLLAPWVSMTAEGGINAGAYKWLKYIPNSMIKTVQAAEWKMTGWRLGKPPSLNHPPVGFDARAPVSSNHPSQLADLDEEEPRTSLEDELESHRPSHPPPPPIRRASKKSGTSSEEVEQSYRSRISLESNDRRSIVTDSSMGRSKNSTRFNGSSSSSPLATNNHSLKANLFGKIFNSQSGPSENSSHHHSLKPADPSSPFDHHKSSTLNRVSPNTTPLPLFLNSVASPIPSYGGSCEDETDEKNGFIVNHHKDNNHLPIYSNNKRTSQKMKSCYSESKCSSRKKAEDMTEEGARRTRSQTMLQQPISRQASSSSQSQPPILPMKPEDEGAGGSQQSHHQSTSEGKSRVRRSLGISLLRASYSESLRGGTSDLITILEKNSKPWGFSYAEIDKPVKIWHGDKDERLSFKGSQWFINSIDKLHVKNQSSLVIVRDATHSLMTDVNVLYQVFESIADQWSASASSLHLSPAASVPFPTPNP
ncbi:hypothetical protein PGT21_014258 [Puccinia graminis f. sp. tritici]|uniref:AB hydrolase-1 domain-containing protein n=1 Tax=Puccinia graminis f. sp. tritici TaxID=56615 RepID=A0A5B0QAF7_PUCGR|nr:hypothetical protein PGT21_014258 [Puccinia graminis f. sp. tritici]